ncbi:hypothetical protein SEA_SHEDLOCKHOLMES_79 [Mycobacterium phage ShedlockHolmes]|uniref:Uncharacterized protein n=1 Tax=Mycobacterium phage ShedlockHolmes TaxID=1647313 RepID=A0A0F6WFA9_9CAUD|nr:hypothetical protein SEA_SHEDLOCKHOLMES_79 [Mycobacterium phage ShedlockHolmes]AKF15256.1 hypothetical protein SEA_SHEDLOCKHOLMES_79 [Mycobacterium phage ShedlockHolmes]
MIIDTATRSLTDEGFDLADKVAEFIDDRPYQWFTPSKIARGIKADSVQVWQVLQWLEREVMVQGSGTGRLRKYAARTSHC